MGHVNLLGLPLWYIWFTSQIIHIHSIWKCLIWKIKNIAPYGFRWIKKQANYIQLVNIITYLHINQRHHSYTFIGFISCSRQIGKMVLDAFSLKHYLLFNCKIKNQKKIFRNFRFYSNKRQCGMYFVDCLSTNRFKYVKVNKFSRLNVPHLSNSIPQS